MAEEKKTCETCNHNYLGPGYEPCASCDDDCSNWETINTKKAIEEQSWISKEPEKYTYFVAYTWLNKNGQQGFANGVVTRTARITTDDDVKSVTEAVKEKGDFLDVVLFNWKELEG